MPDEQASCVLREATFAFPVIVLNELVHRVGKNLTLEELGSWSAASTTNRFPASNGERDIRVSPEGLDVAEMLHSLSARIRRNVSVSRACDGFNPIIIAAQAVLELQPARGHFPPGL